MEPSEAWMSTERELLAFWKQEIGSGVAARKLDRAGRLATLDGGS
jgi:hypothetical protein